MLSFNALSEVSEVDLTIMARNHSILASSPTGSAPVRGVISAKMLYFLATMVESSSETSHSALDDNTNGRLMLYRSEIDNHGE